MILRLAVINIPTKVGPAAWRECFEETADRADIFGINEAFSPRAKRLYRRLAKTLGLWFYLVFRSPNPLFYDSGMWRRVAGSQHRLHGRGPWWPRWPGYNAARYASVAVFDRRDDPEAPWVTVINTHLVPRGRKVTNRWRERARRRSLAKLSQIIERHLELGRAVVIMGDLNMNTSPALPGVVWVTGPSVDKIGVACPAGWRIAIRTVFRYAAPTDHDRGVSAVVHLERIGAAA